MGYEVARSSSGLQPASGHGVNFTNENRKAFVSTQSRAEILTASARFAAEILGRVRDRTSGAMNL